MIYNIFQCITKFTMNYFLFRSSIFFQLPILKEDHYLLPFFEALGINHEHQYPLHDYNNVKGGTCFKQAVFAGKFYYLMHA